MRRIQDVICEAEERLFVGREQELELMKNKLLNTKAPWGLLHFHGPAGIGKTSLLRAFIRKIRHYEVFYFDRIGGFPTADEFLHRLASMLTTKGYSININSAQDQMISITKFLNDLAVQKGLLILIFDSYEKWGMLDDWLWEVWLPMLVPQIRICSAGQFPLKKTHTNASGWGELIHNMQIHPLSEEDVKKYARIRGIEDQVAQDEIEKFSAGVPLALSLSCEVVLQQGFEKLRDSVLRRETIGQLVEKLLKDINNDYFQNILDISCVLWRFDQDLLTAIAGEPISNESFREFCRLPFISVCDQGWSLHDAIRQWIKVDILHRAPEKYAQYRNNALKELRRRELKAIGEEKIQFAIEKLYLYENDWLQSYFFNTHGNGVTIRPMQQEDVPRVEEIYRIWSLNTPPNLLDSTHQETFIRPLLVLEPSAFSTVWFDGELIGFHSFVPLNEETRLVFQQNPVFSGYIKQTKLKEKEFVAWIGGVLPGYERKVMGVQLRQLFYYFTKAHQIIGIGYYTNLKLILQSMGFERIQSADYISQNGTQWLALQLDLKDRDFLIQIDKRLESFTRKYPVISKENMIDFVKKVLVHFESLEQQVHILEKAQRIEQFISDSIEKDIPLADLLRKYLMEAIEDMKTDRASEKELYRILQLAYIDKIGSHDVVASRLNLSISTYYRYLKKAVEKLSLIFCKRCSIDTLKEIGES